MEGKFYSIFSFLFGWGIALQLAKRTERGVESIGLVRRRLVILFFLGLAHLILLWFGDIVAFYALVGFPLLAMRKWKDKTLLITSIVLLLSPILLYALKMNFEWARWPRDVVQQTATAVDARLNNINSDEEFISLIHTMDYFQSLKLNLAGVFFRYSDLFFQSRIPKVLGMFILGYLMGRNGRHKTIIENKKLLVGVALVGLAIGLPANVVMEALKDDSYYQLKPKGLYATIAYAIGVAPLALAYIALFFLAARKRFFSRLFRLIQPVGKMAFTNYLLHSLIGLLVFTGVGLALDRQFGVIAYTVFGLVIFTLQVVISTLWLRYFQFGPVEWLWRSATYKKWQPFRREKEEERVAAVAEPASL